MSEPFVFDSRCEYCKTPYGAVPCGGAVLLRVRPLTSEGFTGCTLALRMEFSGVSRELALTCRGPEGDRTCFAVSFSAPQTPELCWYSFRLSRDDGSGCTLDRSGYRSGGSEEDWQLTVYDSAEKTPGWFGAGMTYQIFPDRFCRLAVPDPAGMPGSRRVHDRWDEEPDWQPDPDGTFRCRDFFGGSLAGIASKLDELRALGVTTLYLNPIFLSVSNHRYNTADYLRIDPMLGSEADFRALCSEAHRRNMRVMLDGVFNHTGSDSVYFNARGRFPEPGAAQSRESRFYPWYRFSHWPDRYDCWWGIDTLPAVDEGNENYRAFIFGDENSVVRRWLRAGADGWRLDVADELPDNFIAGIRRAMDETKPGSLLMGEVWEDGTTKIAYTLRRKYLLGREVHGLMNYPFRTAAIAYLRGGDAAAFCEAMETLREHYPRSAFFSAMNFLGTHDTPRILTVLGARAVPDDRAGRAAYRLDAPELTRGRQLLAAGAVLLFAFPGSPTVLYGDEAGMQGFEDPLNRGTYPWGREDSLLRERFRLLARLRNTRPSLQRGSLRWLYAAGPGLAFLREEGAERTAAALNAGDAPLSLELPWAGASARELLSGEAFAPENGILALTLPPRTGFLLSE
ncbi:MAG: glycoside hydrolase family 13 protein [Oscillibacter sp.]|jgi:4-alpha-glucanotransferase|nr:glycoside hydrolase family 13 protein [Oscillibacter sp.]